MVVNGKVEYHGSCQNLGLTGYWVNMMKGRFGPPIISLVRLSQDLRQQGASKDSTAWNHLIDQFDHFAVITAPSKLNHSSRAKRVAASVDDVQRFAEKCKRPVATEKEAKLAFGKVPEDHRRGPIASMHDDWTPARMPVIKSIIAEMEVRYGRTEKKATDGSPWPFIEHHMPAATGHGYDCGVFSSLACIG
jgi:hypothetical protein